MQDAFTHYEIGLKLLLARIDRGHPRHLDALSLEAQLRENIAQSRMEGDTESRRADRNRIVNQLNRLALEATGSDFNSLCSAGLPTSSAVEISAPQRAADHLVPRAVAEGDFSIGCSWREGLTEEQVTVVSHAGSHARLLAGPGTGKTHCLVRRIEYLITEEGVSPDEIVALTFTRAAAAELRERVRERLGLGEYAGPRITTLHSFALRQLLRNSGLVSLPQPLRIADDYEERHIILEEIKGLLGIDVRRVRDLFDKLSADWQTLDVDRGDWEAGFPDPRFLGAWREHRAVYGYTLRAEMVYQLKRALEQRGDFRLESPLRHLLVDEYQDLNRCDLAVIREFAERGAELYVAGDDDQSIYGFRFAHPEGIRRFEQDYPQSKSLALTQCQRCAPPILDLAQFVARLDIRRIAKDIVAAGDRNGIVKILRFRDQFAEGEGVARLCQWLIDVQGCSPGDILILMRLDKDQGLSRVIRSYLAKSGLPCETVVDPLSPLDEPAGRSLLCALRLLVNPEDHLAWRVWLQIKARGIGAQTLASVYELARQQKLSYTSALERIRREPDLIRLYGRRLAAAVDSLLGILDQVRGIGEDDWETQMHYVGQMLIGDSGEREKILSLFRGVQQETKADSLEKMLHVLQVSLGEKEQTSVEDRIRLMTMHQAKGLTARAVIIVGAEDQFIPRDDSPQRVHDERRLLYVSLTRACQFLFVTHCDRRLGSQRYMGRDPGSAIRHLTRFLVDGPVPSEDGERYLAELV